MKVSSKIISGFLVLMLLSIVVVAYEVSVVYQMQAVNRELADVDVKAAATALDMEKLVDLLDEYSKKYFGGLDPLYDKKAADYRGELDNFRRRHTPTVYARRWEKFMKPWKATGRYTTT